MGLKYEFFDGGTKGEVETVVHNSDNPVVGTTATEIDRNMRKENWGGLFKNDQQRDHCKFLEKKIANDYICKSQGRQQLKATAVEHLIAPYL